MWYDFSFSTSIEPCVLKGVIHTKFVRSLLLLVQTQEKDYSDKHPCDKHLRALITSYMWGAAVVTLRSHPPPVPRGPADSGLACCRQRPQTCLLHWGGCLIPPLVKQTGIRGDRAVNIKDEAAARWGFTALVSDYGCFAMLCGVDLFFLCFSPKKAIFLYGFVRNCFLFLFLFYFWGLYYYIFTTCGCVLYLEVRWHLGMLSKS